MEEDKKEEIKIVKVTEELIKAKTYEVRGYKVMLDFDLAKIYGYSTKAFNQQVKNNSERFASDFAFKLTKEEVNNLRSKNLTSSWGGSRYLPNAFTEQGIYMLMTILKGDEVYASIYRQAKVSIYVVDNYIGLRTLVHLKNSQSGVSIILFSDNVGNNKLHNIEFTDFCKEYPNVKISMQKTGEIFHDRFIVLDYGTADERVFLCGASSKDAGARITSIVEDYGTKKYASVMATLLQNPPLVLPK